MTAPIQKRLCIIVISAMGTLIVVIGVAIIILCKGHLIYTYDDPYISLALSQHIAHGHYGINANEASSPSSSILFPFLLASFAWLSWQEWVPAIFNALAACTTAALVGVEMCRLGILTGPNDAVRGALLTVALCIACNAVGLVYIGLEHSLHVLTSVLVVIGLARVLEGERVPPWLVFAIVLLPLWRFEGLALAGISILALAMLTRWRAAMMAGLGIGVTLGAYAAAMTALGLPVLPSSVLLKSDVAQQALAGSLGFLTLLNVMLHRAVGSVETPEAWPVIILICLVAAHPLLRAFRDPMLRGPYRMSLGREALFAAVIAGALGTHVLLGSWGWFGRYESYAVATGAMGAIIIWHRALAGLVTHGSSALIAASIAILFYVGNVYVISTLRTPVASLGIFEQQYQMHRFAVDFYKKAVGVNDLGWVSYRNPNYVLDLAGLGSETARIARMSTPINSVWVERLVAARQVGLVMIYDSWFEGQIPPHWHRIAVLKSTHLITASSDVVSFYATSKESVGDALEALRGFSHSTGAGTQLAILGKEESFCRLH
jgi:hypothetical protein